MTLNVRFASIRSVLLLSTGLALATAPAHLAAEDSAADTSEQPPREIIVTAATRTEQPLDKIGQTVSVIDLAEIERRQTQNVADILRTIPGVTIARNGAIGALERP